MRAAAEVKDLFETVSDLVVASEAIEALLNQKMTSISRSRFRRVTWTGIFSPET